MKKNILDVQILMRVTGRFLLNTGVLFFIYKFLQHPYDSTGADYKLKGGLSCLLACLFILGKFQDAYWLICEPMRNKAKVAGNLAQLHCTV